MHHLLHLFIGPKRLASHCLVIASNAMKVTAGAVWQVQQMWKALE
jgi:hypothetical protein